MEKHLVAIVLAILASIVLVVFFSVISTGDEAIEMETNRQLTLDEQIMENAKRMHGVQKFLSKYPDAKSSINGHKDIVTYKIYLDEEESQNPPYELLTVLLNKEKHPTDISLECWNGKEKHTVTGDYNVQSSIQEDFCKISK